MRRNIWEVNNLLFCPIAGYCLTPSEQMKLVFNSEAYQDALGKGIDLHHFIIDSICRPTTFAVEIQKILDTKFSREIEASINLSAREWLENTRRYLRAENLGAYIWISAAYKNLSEDQYKLVFRYIHNLGHEIFFEYEKMEKRIGDLEKQNHVLNENYLTLSRRRRKEPELISRYMKTIPCRERNINTFDDLRRNNAGGTEETLFKMVKKMQSKIERQDEIINDLFRKNKNLAQLIQEGDVQFADIKKETESLVKKLGKCLEQCPDCEKINLCQKRILLVGSMEQMKKFYEEIVVRSGGKFKYYDGNLNQSGLDKLVRWSDLVLCPVDVNSRDACLKVEHECKSNGKRYFMLRKSSLSIVYRTLSDASF